MKTFFEWFRRNCGYCMAGEGQDGTDCACTPEGRFECINMVKCTIENCIPIKNLPQEIKKAIEEIK
jgi:hypothetical protein